MKQLFALAAVFALAFCVATASAQDNTDRMKVKDAKSGCCMSKASKASKVSDAGCADKASKVSDASCADKASKEACAAKHADMKHADMKNCDPAKCTDKAKMMKADASQAGQTTDQTVQPVKVSDQSSGKMNDSK